ncbi:MAG: hypothetical protein AAGU05_07550 [Anaerolineaceae bacterium]
MKTPRIGLLEKKRGNYALQEKLAGAEHIIDETADEVMHHEQALLSAGYDVCRIEWSHGLMSDLLDAQVDLVFNVSSLAEAAILEEIQIPYAGSDVYAIVAASEKSISKKLWQFAGLPTSPFRVADAAEDCAIFEDHPPFDYPLFVKPVAGRGSAGISRYSVVNSYAQLTERVEKLLETIGQPVLIERFLRGREVTVGVLGNPPTARALPPLEIVYRTGDITLSFDKKAADNDTFLCPAPLDETSTQAVQRLALNAYRVLGLKDFGRIDMILTDEGPFLLEANSFAGLVCTPPEKPRSYIGFMAGAEGMSGSELLDEIVHAALARNGLKTPALQDRDPAIR